MPRYRAEEATGEVSGVRGRASAAILPDYVRSIIETTAAAWAVKGRPQRLGPEDWRELGEVLKGLMAVRDAPVGALDLRSFSRKTTGDSKLIERNMGRIAYHLRRPDSLPDYLEDARQVLAHYGLEKFPQPILAAGPLIYRGSPLGQAPYAGLAPEVAAGVTAGRQAQSILTIENLASFNRHVREALSEDEIVIYISGFPARHTLAFIRRLAEESGAACYHWRDIDLGGLRIAPHLHENLPGRLNLHLMSEALALARGQPMKPLSGVDFSPDSPISGLARFLASEKAHSHEQEEIDPLPLAVSSRLGDCYPADC